MNSCLLLLPWLLPTPLAVERVQVRIDNEQAHAMLAFAAGTGAWEGVATTEGYTRLKQREAHMGRAITDDEFRRFAGSKQLKSRVRSLRTALNDWSQTDVDQIASRVLAYLPSQARIHATVYLVVKPRSNNFVFEARTNPAVFLYLDPAASRQELENTVAHELHHIGLASLADNFERAYAPLTPNVRAAAEWLGAFGEGIAMLAAAGAPLIHPHQHSSRGDRVRWDKAVAHFGADLRKVEAFLVDIVSGRLDEAQQRDRGMAFFDVQGPWYTVGWKMATAVETVLGRPTLIACMEDLRLLLVRYNETARLLDLPLWSADLLAQLGPP